MNVATPTALPYTALQRFVNIWAWLCLLLTFWVYLRGALVTSYGVGMAVPDGATSFGEQLWIFKWWDKPFGVQLEHTHRLWGAAIGFFVVVLTLLLFSTERRTLPLVVGVAALVTVIIQGLIGRYRVDENAAYGKELAALHGAFAPLLTAELVLLICMTSRWQRTAKTLVHPAAGALRVVSACLALAVYLQILVGVLLRHENYGFLVHASLAYFITLAAVGLSVRILIERNLRECFSFVAGGLFVVLFLQIILGNASALLTGLLPRELRGEPTNVQAITTAVHQMVGSIVLAAAITTAVFLGRQLRRPNSGAAA